MPLLRELPGAIGGDVPLNTPKRGNFARCRWMQFCVASRFPRRPGASTATPTRVLAWWALAGSRACSVPSSCGALGPSSPARKEIKQLGLPRPHFPGHHMAEDLT